MTSTKRVLLAAVVAAASTAALSAQAPPASLRVKGTTARPKEFGTDAYTVTVIPAFSFTADRDTETDFGHLYKFFPLGILGWDAGHMFAGVDIPAGAIVDFIGLQGWDCGKHGTATLFNVAVTGMTGGIVSVESANQPPSCVVGSWYNPTALGWQLQQNVHNAMVADVYFEEGGTFDTEFTMAWVEVWWKRSVSPAPATPSFNDVPTTDGGFQYIEALAASGITGGCGGGKYCPEATLTRRQMTIFLAKALGLHWPN